MNNITINADATMSGISASLLANRYRVVKQLGQGGMGSVWLAEDTVLDNRQVAIKMLPSILFQNKKAYKQLKGEALVAMKLAHPNIANVRSFEENGGYPLIVEDYIDGQTLDAYLADHEGPLSVEETRKLLAPVAAALDYAHAKGIVHRDVKPGNVMIASDGTPFVLDFGIAREAQETMTMVTGRLSSGTLLYMGPEQLRGHAPTPAQDVYSFAAMVYECLSGNPPFCRGQIEYQIINELPPPLPTTLAIGNAVMSGLSKAPAARPATCAGVLEERARDRFELEDAPLERQKPNSELEELQDEIARLRDELRKQSEREAHEAAIAKAKTDLKVLREKFLMKQLCPGHSKTIILPGGAELELVWCPPGEFLMGSPTGEEGRGDDEVLHRVTLMKGFWIGKCEVTQAQWKSVMANSFWRRILCDSPSHFINDNSPVENVSWFDCQDFLKKAGFNLRLPTEAEWECACRAGTMTAYSGTGNLDEMGWHEGNSGRQTHPVGQKEPNGWGLCDMHGNVWEWCQDWYGAYGEDAIDPGGPPLGDLRVCRGGGWSSSARCCRSADRGGNRPGFSDDSIGFRVACSEL